jgi:hypothetical protein
MAFYGFGSLVGVLEDNAREHVVEQTTHTMARKQEELRKEPGPPSSLPGHAPSHQMASYKAPPLGLHHLPAVLWARDCLYLMVFQIQLFLK